MLTRRAITGLLLAAAVASLAKGSASAQTWPSRVVRVVVPFTPGGGIDAIGRILAGRLSEMWGQQVIVENKPGAGGNIASEMVARSEPDGYTIYISATGLAVNPFLFGGVTYDPVTDFAPVTLICFFPNLLVVPTASPFQSVADIVATTKANPGKINYASPGAGSSPHMSAELFKYLAKVDMTHVPYRGASPAYSDLLAGRVDLMFSVMASGLPLVRSGQLRALGVTTAARVPSAPEVPTIAEAGVPDYETSSWFAFFLPAKTPAVVIRKIHTDTIAALAEPAIRQRLDQLGVIAVGSTPEELATYLKSEIDRWGPVIQAAGIRVRD
jgi:tripartite-type tricarboxylate transporter receptor subunit TctC